MNHAMRKSNRLPNLRNLGVALRILVITNALLALTAMILSSNAAEFVTLVTNISAIAQPMLLLSLLLLYASYPLLKSYVIGTA